MSGGSYSGGFGKRGRMDEGGQMERSPFHRMEGSPFASAADTSIWLPPVTLQGEMKEEALRSRLGAAGRPPVGHSSSLSSSAHAAGCAAGVSTGVAARFGLAARAGVAAPGRFGRPPRESAPARAETGVSP